ncbi:TetR family transcriptional regulator [Streptomyces bambusae]|uniref:TetR family transcriptional regulator n=1 Tax=Streptomyces bambusae TaxID=1550616 RepID=A0ABS6Z1W1_9ACTN|nr:TetR family transcriptional regulator [Streptomyces bambusae]
MEQGRRHGGSRRSQVRRAELIAIGRRLFGDTPYDALSMDDIAQQAGVAKGLVYYYFTSKRGFYLAVIEDSVGDLLALAAVHPGLPAAERVRRTVDGYLRYADRHRAAYRTLVTGGVGSDAEVLAVRDAVREELAATVAEGAYGHRALPPLARLALVGWLAGVEAVTLDWIGVPGPADRPGPLDRPGPPDRPSRTVLCALLVRQLRATLEVIEGFVPECPAPPPAPAPFDLAPVTGTA